MTLTKTGADTTGKPNWVTIHSGTFIDQIPTCCPGSTPSAIKPDATRSTRWFSSRQDQPQLETGKHQGILVGIETGRAFQDLPNRLFPNPGKAWGGSLDHGECSVEVG